MNESTDTAQRETALWQAFELYEKALVGNDIEVMNSFFLNSEEIVRFGIVDEQWGFSELTQWRQSAPAVPTGRRLSSTQVQMLDEQTAVVTTLFEYPERAVRGRQTQVWRCVAGQWLIVNAHVSEREAE